MVFKPVPVAKVCSSCGNTVAEDVVGIDGLGGTRDVESISPVDGRELIMCVDQSGRKA